MGASEALGDGAHWDGFCVVAKPTHKNRPCVRYFLLQLSAQVDGSRVPAARQHGNRPRCASLRRMRTLDGDGSLCTLRCAGQPAPLSPVHQWHGNAVFGCTPEV